MWPGCWSSAASAPTSTTRSHATWAEGGRRTWRSPCRHCARSPTSCTRWAAAVAAHLGDRGTQGQIRQFQADGLDGIEVRHPSHSEATERRLAALAERLGLAISGGSDWHGDVELGDSHAGLGEMDVPLEWLEKLDQRRATASREPVAQNRKDNS